MKAKLHRQTLLDASNRLIGFVSKKPITPIFGCYFMHFSHNRLSMIACEGDHQITTDCDANCPQEDLRLCIPAIKFHNILYSMVDVDVNFSIKGKEGSLQHLVMKFGKAKHEFPITDPMLFPVIKKPESLHVMKVNASVLLSMWKNISVLVDSKDSLRPQMAGINHITHELVPGEVVLCGGTSFRCAMASCAAETGNWRGIVIHGDLTKRAEKVFSQDMSTITISHDGSRCIITDGVSKIITRGLEGKFYAIPEMVKKIHALCSHNMVFSSSEISDALKRLQFHKTETVNTLRAQISDKGLNLNFTNNDMGTSGDEEIAISCNPSPMELGINIDRLSDCINSCNSQSVDMAYCDPTKAFVLQPVDQVKREWSMSVLLAPSILN